MFLKMKPKNGKKVEKKFFHLKCEKPKSGKKMERKIFHFTLPLTCLTDLKDCIK